MSIDEKIQQLLDEQVEGTLKRALEELRDHVASITRMAAAEGGTAVAPGLVEAAAAIDRAATQAAVLGALLEGAGRYASRAALFLARSDHLQGWGGIGFGETAVDFGELTLEYGTEGGWARFTAGKGCVQLSAADCARLSSRLESPVPEEGVLIPLVLRDQIAAAVYADRHRGGANFEVEALQLLTQLAGQTIETLSLRDRRETPTLHFEERVSAAQGLRLWGAEGPAPAAPPEAAEPEQAATPEAAPKAMLEDVAPQETVSAAEDESPQSMEEVSAPEAAPAPPEVWGEPLETEAEEPPSEPAAAPEPGVGRSPAGTEEVAIEPTAQPEVSVEAEEEAPTEAPPVAGPTGAETVMFQQPQVEAPEAPSEAPRPASAEGPPAAATPAAPPAPPGATTQVAPPTDLEGPGSAFTALPAGSGEQANVHQEAQRLARLLVSEIKLYNEEQVEEGRRNRDIYPRLKEDIDRSREMYEERIDESIRGTTDYFSQELVRILAGGDPKALGM